MTVEVLLNLLWVAFALAGFAGLLCRSRWQADPCARIKSGHLIAVFLIVFSLFPAVSASDDALHYRFLTSPGDVSLHSETSRTGAVPEGIVLNLIRLFDSLEHSTTAAVSLLFLLLLILGAAVRYESARAETVLLCRSGRAPPSLA